MFLDLNVEQLREDPRNFHMLRGLGDGGSGDRPDIGDGGSGDRPNIGDGGSGDRPNIGD